MKKEKVNNHEGCDNKWEKKMEGEESGKGGVIY